jgi:hypothetical protein
MLRKMLLVCGILSSLLYAAMTVFIAMQWKDYNSASQTISELSAIGAPTRSFWVLPGAVYTVLVTAFGCGVWMSAGRNRALRRAGGLILAYGSLGLLWPFAPMHSREVLASGGGTLSDTIHVALGGVTVLLMLLAIGFAAPAFGKRFRLYSIASLAILLTFGVLTFIDAPKVGSNLPTPWLGVWQRINLGVFLLWIVVACDRLVAGTRYGGNSWRTGAVSRMTHIERGSPAHESVGSTPLSQPLPLRVSRWRRTPPFRTVTGEIVRGSIAEDGYLRLGGIDQWVIVWFDESGHEPFVDEPVKFNQAMVALVRPVAETP